MTPTFGFYLAFLSLLVVLAPKQSGASSVGVCYGRDGNNLPSSAHAVEMLKAHKIKMVRLYEPVQSTLEALRNTSIRVVLGMDNFEIRGIAAYQYIAPNWVRENIKKYSYQKIDYLVVGNEAIPGTDSQWVLSAMRNLHNSLKDAGLQNTVKVTTAVSSRVLNHYKRPSDARFSDESRPYMEPIVRYLAEIGSPLLANVHPYKAYTSNRTNNISLRYALFGEDSSAPGLRDGRYRYINLFDTMLDAFYVALEKVNAPHMKIVVSATGWPTSGGDGASIDNAKSYNSRLIDHISSSRGTPRRQGVRTKVYLFSLFDENGKSKMIDKHWGIFHANQKPIYSLTFS